MLIFALCLGIDETCIFSHDTAQIIVKRGQSGFGIKMIRRSDNF